MAKKKKSNRLIYISVGVLVLIIVGVLVAKSMGWIGSKKPTEVILSKIQKVDIVEKVSASGKVQPEIEIKVSPDVPGEIRELLILEGDSVKKGQLLLRIRPDNYQSVVERSMAAMNTQKANLSQAKASFEQSKARYLQSKRDYERSKKLFDQKMISTAELETAQTNMDVAEANYKADEQRIEAARFSVLSSEASLKEANTNLSLTDVFAPMDGVVSKLAVSKGERVVGTAQMAGTEMLRIADLSNMEVLVDVNENDIIRVNVGDTALVEVDSYNSQKFKGLVTNIANSAKSAVAGSDVVTEFQVKIRILRQSYEHLITPREPSPFRPGMTASVEIITERKAGVIGVPLAAVTTRNDKQEEEKDAKKPENEGNDTKKAPKKDDIKEVVFVEENGKAKMISVKTGISDFDNIEILEGVKEGAQVISGPYLEISKKLKDGDLVVPKKEVKKE